LLPPSFLSPSESIDADRPPGVIRLEEAAPRATGQTLATPRRRGPSAVRGDQASQEELAIVHGWVEALTRCEERHNEGAPRGPALMGGPRRDRAPLIGIEPCVVLCLEAQAVLLNIRRGSLTHDAPKSLRVCLAAVRETLRVLTDLLARRAVATPDDDPPKVVRADAVVRAAVRTLREQAESLAADLTRLRTAPRLSLFQREVSGLPALPEIGSGTRTPHPVASTR
jgi:hypothetical protein